MIISPVSGTMDIFFSDDPAFLEDDLSSKLLVAKKYYPSDEVQDTVVPNEEVVINLQGDMVKEDTSFRVRVLTEDGSTHFSNIVTLGSEPMETLLKQSLTGDSTTARTLEEEFKWSFTSVAGIIGVCLMAAMMFTVIGGAIISSTRNHH